MISIKSIFASSAPATSANVTFGVSPASNLALDFPNENALFPPACIWRKIKNQIAINTIHGRNCTSSTMKLARSSCAVMRTFFSRKRSSSRSEFSTGSFTVNFDVGLPFGITITGCLNSPVISLPPVIVTLARLSSFSC